MCVKVKEKKMFWEITESDYNMICYCLNIHIVQENICIVDTEEEIYDDLLKILLNISELITLCHVVVS